MITEYTHFVGLINLPNTDPTSTEGKILDASITALEPLFLTDVFGYTLANLIMQNESATSGVYFELINGKDFTDSLGRANHWDGLKVVGHNPIANYIYTQILINGHTRTLSLGEYKPNIDNNTQASPMAKIARAWSDMNRWLWTMHDFLVVNKSDYPDYIGLTYPPFLYANYNDNYRPHHISNVKYFNPLNQIF